MNKRKTNEMEGGAKGICTERKKRRIREQERKRKGEKTKLTGN